MQVPVATAWLIEVDTQICTLCGVCAQRCVPEALRLVQADDSTLLLLFESNRCDGCAYCVEYCPETAVRLVKLSRSEIPKDPVQLIATTLSRCENCGSSFHPENLRRRVVSKLISAGVNEASVARRAAEIYIYCPECRWRLLKIRG